MTVSSRLITRGSAQESYGILGLKLGTGGKRPDVEIKNVGKTEPLRQGNGGFYPDVAYGLRVRAGSRRGTEARLPGRLFVRTLLRGTGGGMAVGPLVGSLWRFP